MKELDADMGTQVSAHEGPMHHRGYNMNAPCHNVKSQSRHTNDTDKPPKGDRRLGGGKGFHGSILKTFTKHSRSIHKTLTKHSQSIHSVFTKHSQSTRKTLTKHSQFSSSLLLLRVLARGGKGRDSDTDPGAQAGGLAEVV